MRMIRRGCNAHFPFISYSRTRHIICDIALNVFDTLLYLINKIR